MSYVLLCLYYFAFVLFVNINENINQHWCYNYTLLSIATVLLLCIYILIYVYVQSVCFFKEIMEAIPNIILNFLKCSQFWKQSFMSKAF